MTGSAAENMRIFGNVADTHALDRRHGTDGMAIANEGAQSTCDGAGIRTGAVAPRSDGIAIRTGGAASRMRGTAIANDGVASGSEEAASRSGGIGIGTRAHGWAWLDPSILCFGPGTLGRAMGTVFEIEQLAASGPGAAQMPASATDPFLQVDRLGRRAMTGAVREWVPQGLVWEVATGRPVAGRWLALHDDGAHALRSDEGVVTFCAIDGGEALATMDFPVGRVPSGLTMCSDAPFAAAGPRVYSLRTGKRVHDLAVNGFTESALLPGGRLLVLDAMNTLTAWDLETGALVSTMRGKREKARSMVVDAAGARAAVYTAKLRCELWDLRTSTLLGAWDGRDVHALWTAWATRRRVSLVGAPLGPDRPMRFTGDASRLLLGAFGMHTVDFESRQVRFGVVSTATDRSAIDAWPLPGNRHVAVLGSRQLLGGCGIEIWDLDAQVLVGRRSLEVAEQGEGDDEDPPQAYPRSMALVPGGIVVGYDDGIRTLKLTAREGPLPEQPALEPFTSKLREEVLALGSLDGAPARKAAPKKAKKPAKRRPLER